MHTAGMLNSLTTGQLQRKIHYATTQFKHADETLHGRARSASEETKTTSKRDTECSGRIDMAVTVRQIDQSHDRPASASSSQNWKGLVDRLFAQGHSSEEIQRLLNKAADTTTTPATNNDRQRLQDVFAYINTKARSTSSGIEFRSAAVSKVLQQQGQPIVSVQTEKAANDSSSFRSAAIKSVRSSVADLSTEFRPGSNLSVFARKGRRRRTKERRNPS